MVGQQSNGLPKVEQHLSVSTDHLRSWQPIDSGLIAVGQSVTHFWIHSDGQLLAEVTPTAQNAQGNVFPTSYTLWTSHDSGAHWQHLPLPTITGNEPYHGFIAQQSTSPGPWRICADYAANEHESIGSIVCTFDSGRTWTVRRTLCVQNPCTVNPSNTMIEIDGALTSDNSILVGALAPGSNDHFGLYRLPPDSSQWQYLGPMTGGIFYIASARGGVLWQFAGGIYLGRFSGDIGGHLGSLPSVLLSTASYP